MLFALGDPLSLLVLALGFVLAVWLHGAVRVALSAGPPRRLRPVGAGPRGARRRLLDPRGQLDPFGTVAAALGGVGWGRPAAEPKRRPVGRAVLGTLGPGAVDVLLGCGLVSLAHRLAAFQLGAGAVGLLRQGAAVAFPSRLLLLVGLVFVFTGILSWVPVPPLDGGRLLFGLAPRSAGWQRARYYLEEQNLGVVLLLLLLILGSQSVLLRLLDLLAAPLLRAVTGA